MGNNKTYFYSIINTKPIYVSLFKLWPDGRIEDRLNVYKLRNLAFSYTASEGPGSDKLPINYVHYKLSKENFDKILEIYDNYIVKLDLIKDKLLNKYANSLTNYLDSPGEILNPSNSTKPFLIVTSYNIFVCYSTFFVEEVFTIREELPSASFSPVFTLNNLYKRNLLGLIINNIQLRNFKYVIILNEEYNEIVSTYKEFEKEISLEINNLIKKE